MSGSRSWLGWLAPAASIVVLALLVVLVHATHARFLAGDQWADVQIAAGIAEPSARPGLVTTYRSTYGVADTEGGWLPYTVGNDSYYFMRLAARIAETGSACDAIVEGQCWDNHAGAPLGRPVVDPWAPHPWLLAMTHVAYGWIEPERNLIASARLYGALSLMAFAVVVYVLGRRLGGPGLGGQVAGFAGAALVVFHRFVIERSFGADDDVCILILTALGLLLTADALAARGTRRMVLALGAGLACGLLAMSWGGWPFLVFVIAVAIVAVSVPALPRLPGWQGVATAARGEVARLLLGLALGLGVLLVAFSVPLDIMGMVSDILGLVGLGPRPVVSHAPPPDAFATVAELKPLDIWQAMAAISWPVVAAIAAGIALVSRRLARQPGDTAAAALFVALLAWLIAALVLVGVGQRFTLLLATPAGLLAGAGLGGLVDLVRARLPRVALVLAVAAVALAATDATSRALDTVRYNRPNIDSAWVVALARLKDVAPDNAVVLGWWDIGHWAAFWSTRPVAVDGASLHDPRVHAIGRLLAANADHSVLAAIRDAACVGDGLLCPDGGVYLITSTGLLSIDAWLLSGAWEPGRAWLVDVLAGGADPGVDADSLAARIRGDDSARIELVDAARAVANARERAFFAAPQARLWSSEWHGCTAAPDGTYTCSLDIESLDGWLIESVHIDPARAADAVFGIRRMGDDSDQLTLLAPSMVRMALPERLVEAVTATPGDTNPGVLFDPVEARVFVGTPTVLRSLLARLLLLGGHYDRHRFEPVAVVGTVDGNVVQVWRYLGESAEGS